MKEACHEHCVIPRMKKFSVDETESLHLTDEEVRKLRHFTISDTLSGRFSRQTVIAPGYAGFDYYRISITKEGIQIQCEDEASHFCAVQSLVQIISACERRGRGYTLPSAEIEDYSLFEWRAFMLDISRDRVPSMATLYSLIDMIALLKYNQLQLYMEHTYAYEGHEKVWENASPFTEEDLHEIETYCLHRGIELVPNQNSFGHMERWLMHEEYHHLAEMPEGFTDMWGVFRPSSSTLSPVVEGSSELVDDLLSQLLKERKSEFVNVGGDEPWELGQGRSRQACKENGLEQVYVGFLSRLHDLAGAYGKRVMIWADVLMSHPEVVDTLPPDTVLMDWGYEADHPFEKECTILSSSGYEYVVCTGTSSWNTIGGRWENAYLNMKRAAQAAQAQRRPPRGFMVTEWGDNGHLQSQGIAVPALILASDFAWNGKSSAVDEHETASAAARLFHLVPSLVTGSRSSVPVATELAETLSGVLISLSQAGELYRDYDGGKGIHNSTLLGSLLLDHLAPYYSEDIARFAGYAFSREVQLLESLETLLLESTDTEHPSLLMRDELLWSVRMLLFSCSLGKSRLSGGKELLEYDHLNREEKDLLVLKLRPLIREYRRLWSLRSRPGGVDDSAARLESLEKLLR